MQYQKNIGKTEERKPHKVFTLRKGNKFYIVKAYDIAFFTLRTKLYLQWISTDRNILPTAR
jgi:hypothetical protein